MKLNSEVRNNHMLAILIFLLKAVLSAAAPFHGSLILEAGRTLEESLISEGGRILKSPLQYDLPLLLDNLLPLQIQH